MYTCADLTIVERDGKIELLKGYRESYMARLN